jgi:hypothetical protein
MTSVADIPDDANDDLSGISPELVLVDPELARRVRPVTLTGAWTPAVHAASIRARSRTTPGLVITSPQRFDPLSKRPPLARLSIAAAGAAGCFLVLTTLGGAREYHPTEAPHPTVAHQATGKHVVTSLPAPKPSVSRHSSGPKATRVKWPRARFATFYRVVFIRDRAHRLQISTTRTALSVETLRNGQGLRAGRYRWFVRPGYGNPRFRKVSGRTFYGPVTSRGVVLVRRPD